MRILIRVFICLMALESARTSAAQDSVVLDETLKAQYFEELNYPLSARLKHIQGVVVVKVKFDDSGRVVSSVAVSGAKELIPDCLSNAKKWRFQPTPDKTAIIVYQFR